MSYEYLESAVLSDPGRVRKMNEDSVLGIPEAGVFCVADGMGGAACGEVASAWAVEELDKAFKNPASAASRAALVRKALNRASSRIKALSEERGSQGTGTTAVVLLFNVRAPGSAAVLHAGDSRAYRLRRGKLECITTDHSMAAAAGVKHEKALPAMFRGVVTRAVGLENDVELEETPITPEKGDLYLLCSDGLSKMLPDRKMQKLIVSLGDADLRVMGRQLIEAANAAGGDDNISVALVRVAGDVPAGQAEPVEDDDEISTSETALEMPPASEEDDDSAEDYAGHTPDSSDSLVGVTPGTGETTPAGATLAPTEATLRQADAAAAKSDEADAEPSDESAVVVGEPATPDTNTSERKEAAAVPQAGEPTPPAEKPVQVTGVSSGKALKIGAGVVVVIAVASVLLSVLAKKPEAQEDGVEPVVTEPAPTATEPRPEVAPPEPVAEPQTVEAPPEPEPEVEDETPETDSGTPAARPVEPAEPEPEPAPQPEPEPAPGPEPAPEPEPEPVPPETLISQLAPKLTEQMPRSLTAGTWGDLLVMLEPIEPHLDLARQEVEGLQNSLVWAREWEKAGADKAYAASNLERYTEIVAGVLTAMGYDKIPGGRPVLDTSDDLVADIYCRELFRLRQVLVSRLRVMMSEMKTHSSVLGSNPDQTLMRLHVFVHTPADDNREIAADWTGAISGLETWLAQDSDTLIPLVGIMKGPPQLVPQMMQGREDMWAGLMKELEAGGDAVERWKQSKGRTPVLIEIERLLATVVCRYQAGQGENARIKWPLQDDLENMETLLANISGFVARQ